MSLKNEAIELTIYSALRSSKKKSPGWPYSTKRGEEIYVLFSSYYFLVVVDYVLFESLSKRFQWFSLLLQFDLNLILSFTHETTDFSSKPFFLSSLQGWYLSMNKPWKSLSQMFFEDNWRMGLALNWHGTALCNQNPWSNNCLNLASWIPHSDNVTNQFWLECGQTA